MFKCALAFYTSVLNTFCVSALVNAVGNPEEILQWWYKNWECRFGFTIGMWIFQLDYKFSKLTNWCLHEMSISIKELRGEVCNVDVKLNFICFHACYCVYSTLLTYNTWSFVSLCTQYIVCVFVCLFVFCYTHQTKNH